MLALPSCLVVHIGTFFPASMKWIMICKRMYIHREHLMHLFLPKYACLSRFVRDVCIHGYITLLQKMDLRQLDCCDFKLIIDRDHVSCFPVILECVKRKDWYGSIVLDYAMIHGKLNAVQYFVEHGIPWTNACMYFAAEYGHVSCLEYAYFNKCPDKPKGWNNLYTAVRNGHVDCVVFLLLHDWPYDPNKLLMETIPRDDLDLFIF